MIHYDDEALLMYAEGTSPIREEITAHVGACPRCAEMLSAHQELAALLKSAEVWEEPAAVPPQVAAKGRELATVAQTLDREEAAAVALVDELLASPQRWWHTKLTREGGQNVGVVRALLDRARELAQKTPLQALDLTTLAVDVANELPITGYPSDLVFATRAHAWREHAYVLTVIGKFREALEATDRSEDLFKQTAMPDFELARVELMRANVYSNIDRVSEAILLARKAAATFEMFGDRRRYINAQVTAAAMLFAKNKTRDALEIWLSVIHDPDIEDLTRIMAANNIGLCYRELRDYERACEHLSSVIAELELLGMDALKTKSRNSLGTTLMQSGRHEAAIAVFEQCWREFEALGMESEAALVALELAEALLVIGRPERVPQICRTLLDRFTSAGMTSRAITALAFLREAVAIGQAQPTLVRHVYDFLREIPAGPQRASAALVARLED